MYNLKTNEFIYSNISGTTQTTCIQNKNLAFAIISDMSSELVAATIVIIDMQNEKAKTRKRSNKKK